MKVFWRNNSNLIVKMMITQIGIAVFGFLLDTAAITSGNDLLVVSFGVFSILFYLFLLYTAVWELGSKDKIRVEAKRIEHMPHKGLFISLMANIPNFFFAIISLIGYIFIDKNVVNEEGLYYLPSWAVLVYSLFHLAGVLTHSMYSGIASYLQVSSYPWTLFIMIVPSLLVCELAYSLGMVEKYGMLMSASNQNKNKK